MSLRDERRHFVAVEGAGDVLDLVFDPIVHAGEVESHELRLPWTLRVTVPEPSVRSRSDLDREFPGWDTSSLARPPNPERAAELLFEAARYEEALAAYQNLAAGSPDSKGPNPNRLRTAECLIRLGRHDAAARLLADLERSRPDFRALDNLFRLHPQPDGSILGYRDRWEAARPWKRLDRVAWALKKAREAAGAGE